MGKRKKKTGAEKPEKVVKTDKELSQQKIITDPVDEESTDYGGMPMRDLKKNLGCG